MDIFNAENPSDFCKCVEDVLQTTNHSSFIYTGEFVNKDGIEYDVTISYTKREEK